MYFQAAEVGADFRLLPQKCTESYLQFAQFAQPPPRRRNWSTNPWTTPTNTDGMICTNTHYNSQKVRRHGAMSWRSEKYTSHAGKQTDVYRWSKHLTANWCYLMMFLPTWWWLSWPSWYIQGHPKRMRKVKRFSWALNFTKKMVFSAFLSWELATNLHPEKLAPLHNDTAVN